MGTYKPTAIARQVRRSVDELTFARVRGRNVVKTKIDENKTNSPLQLVQRTRWKHVQVLDEIFDEVILIGFPSRSVHLTSHNAFVKENANCVEVTEDLTTTIHYEEIACSKGRLRIPTATATFDTETNALAISHKPERYGRRCKPTDQLYAMILEKDLQEAQLSPLNTRADDDSVIITLPAEWLSENLYIYVFALSEDGHQASDTTCIKAT